MKDIKQDLVDLLFDGHCTPQISSIARDLSEASSTIHYNIKKLEEDNIVRTYRAVFDYERIGKGFCSFVLLKLAAEEYGDPERIGSELATHRWIESVDVVTGDWELILKVRTENMDAYYTFVKNVISRKGIKEIKSLNSLKQLKSEFIQVNEENRD